MSRIKCEQVRSRGTHPQHSGAKAVALRDPSVRSGNQDMQGWLRSGMSQRTVGSGGLRNLSAGSELGSDGARVAAFPRGGGAAGAPAIQHVDSGPRVALQPAPQAARSTVNLTTTGQCINARAIAEAIPGARSMANMAVNWFLSFGERDRARVARLLRANFLSDSEDTRDIVENRLLSMRRLLDAAQQGGIVFDCVPANDPECTDRSGYVRDGERNMVHICPTFFNLTLEGRRWMLVHECAHLAGAMTLPESYYGLFGPVTEQQCLQSSVSSNVNDALGTADNYARLVWCLTRQSGSEVTPP